MRIITADNIYFKALYHQSASLESPVCQTGETAHAGLKRVSDLMVASQ